MPFPEICCRPVILKVYDIIICCFIIFPAVILYWSGTWKFLEMNILPNHPYSAATLFLMVGLFMLIVGHFTLPLLEDVVALEDLQRDFTRHLMVSKIFNYVIALAIVFQWKGVWLFTELIFGTELKASVIIMCVCLMLLLLLSSLSNATTVPFTLDLDNKHDFYKTAPRFRTQLTPDTVLPYSLDVLFTCLIIDPLSISLWVGLWNSVDASLLPQDKPLSYLVSACVGLLGTILMFALQKPTQYIALRLQENHKVLARIFTTIFLLCVVFMGFILWRGCWGFVDDYILNSPDRIWLMGVFHVVGMSFLWLFQVSRTVGSLQHGVDGELTPGGTAVELNVRFLHYFCRHRQYQQYTVQVESVEESQTLLNSGQSTPVYGGF